MTNEVVRAGTPTPFSFLFSRPIPRERQPPLRYDRTRQLSQVFVDGTWIDCVDARPHAESMSRLTRVAGETRDDE